MTISRAFLMVSDVWSLFLFYNLWKVIGSPGIGNKISNLGEDLELACTLFNPELALAESRSSVWSKFNKITPHLCAAYRPIITIICQMAYPIKCQKTSFVIPVMATHTLATADELQGSDNRIGMGRERVRA